MFVAQAPEIAVAPVGIEIDTPQAWNFFATIDVPTGNADAGKVIGAQGYVVRVFHDGIDEFCAGRDLFLFEIMKAFAVAPAVVSTLLNDVDLFPFVLADVAGVEQAGLVIKTESPGIA